MSLENTLVIGHIAKGSEEWCEDDERAELVFTDAIAWFKNQFLNYTDTNTIGKFDVVIIDAL